MTKMMHVNSIPILHFDKDFILKKMMRDREYIAATSTPYRTIYMEYITTFMSVSISKRMQKVTMVRVEFPTNAPRIALL